MKKFHKLAGSNKIKTPPADYDKDKLEFMETQFDIEKPGVVCLDCGKRATEGEYSCGSCNECGGPIGSECA